MNLAKWMTSMISKNTPPGTKVVVIDDYNVGNDSFKKGNIYTIHHIEAREFVYLDCKSPKGYYPWGGYCLSRFRLLQVEPDEFGEVEDDE
jgi:hypothetical protein